MSGGCIGSVTRFLEMGWVEYDSTEKKAHINVEKRQHAQKLVTFAINPTSRRPIPPIHIRALQDVGHDVQMRQTHALGQARGARAVDQKHKILFGVDVGLPEAGGEVDTPDIGVVPELFGGVGVLADQDDAVVGDAGLLGRFTGRLEEGRLRDDGFGT